MSSSAELDSVEGLAPWNFKWIVHGELAIMGYPKSKENIKYLVDQRIIHLVSLSPEKQPPFEFFPFNFRWTPIDVLEFQPPTNEQIQAFINTSMVALHNNEVSSHPSIDSFIRRLSHSKIRRTVCKCNKYFEHGLSYSLWA